MYVLTQLETLYYCHNATSAMPACLAVQPAASAAFEVLDSVGAAGVAALSLLTTPSSLVRILPCTELIGALQHLTGLHTSGVHWQGRFYLHQVQHIVILTAPVLSLVRLHPRKASSADLARVAPTYFESGGSTLTGDVHLRFVNRSTLRSSLMPHRS
jgi:hypothetical protein